MTPTKLFTIGFTQKSAEEFFTILIESGVKKIIDIRLKNVSQLAGFAKREDLRYFLKTIAGIDYVHLPQFAPTQEILDQLKKRKGKWAEYQTLFMQLMSERHVEQTVSRSEFEQGCLLCSEANANECHRKLVAEYLAEKWGNVSIEHLK